MVLGEGTVTTTRVVEGCGGVTRVVGACTSELGIERLRCGGVGRSVESVAGDATAV